MTGALTAIGYELVALLYAAFSAVVARRRSSSRLSFFFLVAMAATALWAQLFALAIYEIIPAFASGRHVTRRRVASFFSRNIEAAHR
jgi:hypothetical protein